MLKYRWEYLAENAWYCGTRSLTEISVKILVAVNVLREKDELPVSRELRSERVSLALSESVVEEDGPLKESVGIVVTRVVS